MAASALFAGIAVAYGVDLDASARKEFERRLGEYLKLRRAAVAKIPVIKKNADPAEIRANKLAQAEAIRNARTGAAQGDVFTPDFQEYVRALVRSSMKGEPGKAARQTAMAGNPAKDKEAQSKPVEVKVNGLYPEAAPLSSVPPSLLLQLPELPKELDFRFVGHDLILYDVNSGLIVDYIKDVIPQ